jgi:hypothetical protein
MTRARRLHGVRNTDEARSGRSPALLGVLAGPAQDRSSMNTVEATARTAFRVHAIPSRALTEIRLAGHDRFGNELTPVVDEEGGSPLRCCLRRSAPGETMYLIAYRPFSRPGPYAEAGPVFVHASVCAGYGESGAYPAGYRDWPAMVFRPYRHHAVLNCDAIAYDAIQLGGGATAESLISSIFADPTINFIHTRNVHAGCFMFSITRTDEPG